VLEHAIRQYALQRRDNIGYTRLTHSDLTDHADPPECTNCYQLNILTECISYDQTRQQHYIHTNLKDIFNHSPIKTVLGFVKNVNLYDKL